jgi:hypothetical protein
VVFPIIVARQDCIAPIPTQLDDWISQQVIEPGVGKRWAKATNQDSLRPFAGQNETANENNLSGQKVEPGRNFD